jgi:uncharacterized protein (TIGR02118 family)
MIKISVLYPNKEGAKFDMAYYCMNHMPLVKRLLGPAVKGMAVDQGIGGFGPGSPAPYVAVGHLLFDSVDAFQAAFEPHAQAIMGDIANYTSLQPIIQISEIKL